MGVFIVTGKGKEKFCQKLKYINPEIKSEDCIMVNIPDQELQSRNMALQQIIYEAENINLYPISKH